MANEFNYQSLLVREEVYATLDSGDREHPIEVYNPNQEQRRMILDLILENLNVEKEKMSTNISGFDLIFRLIPELTNIPLRFDENNPEDIQKVKEINEDPSDLFLDLNTIIMKLVHKQFYRYYENLKELSMMPSELREEYIKQIDKVKENNKIEITEDPIDKELAELEAKMEALKLQKAEK